MSTILEALKKSEQERKLNDVPRLSDMPVPEESKRWPLYVIAILSLVLALTIGVLISRWLLVPSGPGGGVSATQSTSQVDAGNKSAVEQVNDLNVNVVSYSDNASQRFVMLNGKMYREMTLCAQA